MHVKQTKIHNKEQWNLNITKGQGIGKKCSYNKVSLYRGSFPHILLFAGAKNIVHYTENFVIEAS